MHRDFPNHPELPIRRGRTVKRALSLAVLLLFGCLQTDPVSRPESGKGTGVEDLNLLAGATSSTNWPPEDAGRSVMNIQGRTDSSLILLFRDTSGNPVRMSGYLSLFRAGTIPAIDAPDSLRIDFSDAESLMVDDGALGKWSTVSADTLFFSALIRFDTTQCLLVGFAYSPNLKKFIISPFSEEPNFSATVSSPHYRIHGIPDTSLIHLGFSFEGKSEWCFYIPGSPYFYEVSPDTAIDIGPLPSGKYPIRLLRLTRIEGRTDKELLEAFEAIAAEAGVDATHHLPYRIIRAGDRIFSSLVNPSVSARFTSPKTE